MNPLRTATRADREPEISAASGEIETEFRLVPAVYAKGRVTSVKRAIEKFSTILDDKIGTLWPVAERTVDIVRQIGNDFGCAQRLRRAFHCDGEKNGRDNTGSEEGKADPIHDGCLNNRSSTLNGECFRK